MSEGVYDRQPSDGKLRTSHETINAIAALSNDDPRIAETLQDFRQRLAADEASTP